MPISQTAKNQAISAAKIVVRESNEVLKTAREQFYSSPERPKEEKINNSNENSKDVEGKNPPKNLSFLNEYKNELNEIRRDNLFKSLQAKISEGEDVPLENYINELSFEQREVLKAQMEAIKMQISAQSESKKKEGVPSVVAKKGRQMFNMFKKRNEQHVETRQPPSS